MLDLSFLGAAFPLYFVLIKYCIIVASLIFFISGMYGILTNMVGDDCIDLTKIGTRDLNKICVRNWITEYSLGNKKNRNDLLLG